MTKTIISLSATSFALAIRGLQSVRVRPSFEAGINPESVAFRERGDDELSLTRNRS